MAEFMRLTSGTRLAYLALIISGMLYALHIGMTQPPEVISKTAPADQFSAERAMEVLADLLQQNQPHPVGSTSNQFVKSRIEAQLNQLQIEYRTQRTWACRYQSNHCAMIENLIAEIPGDSTTDKIALMAHYDSVPTSVGAGDDGAAVAAILETARILRLEDRLKRSVVLLFTDGEERGLLGAEAFFNQDNESNNISVVLNYEGSGSKGVVRVLRTSEQNTLLIKSYLDIANPVSGNSLSNEIFKRMPNDTDFSVVNRKIIDNSINRIREGRITGIDFSFADERSHYHTPNDNLNHLDLRTLQHHGNSMLPLVKKLINNDTLVSEPEHLVYTDPYGIGLQWPQDWQPWLIMIATILLVVSLIRLEVTLKQLTIALGISIALPIIATLGGYCMFLLVSWYHGAQPNWPAHLLGFRMMLFAGPTVFALGTMVWLQRFTDTLTLICAAWLWWLLFSLLLTIYLPDAANLWIVALLPATLVLGISSSVPGSLKLKVLLLTLVGAVPATLAVVLPVEGSQGYKLVPAMLLPIGLFLMLVMPLLLNPNLRFMAIFSGLVSITGIGISLLLPLYSEFRPQQYNLNFYQDQDNQTAYIAVTGQRPFPQSLRTGLQTILETALASTSETTSAHLEQPEFSSTEQQLLPFSRWQYSTWSNLHPQDLPSTTVTEYSRSGAEVSLQLTSPTGASEILLYLPTEANLEGFSLDGQAFESRQENHRAYQVIGLIGTYGRSINLQLTTGSVKPIKAYLVTKHQRLPELLEPLVQSRESLGTPVHQGDQALSFRSINL
tara:strand:+ start:1231 stop:3576 length:2346 start_codon:yes stop_codon:yes gene_type:complete